MPLAIGEELKAINDLGRQALMLFAARDDRPHGFAKSAPGKLFLEFHAQYRRAISLDSPESAA